jgi:alkylation response protein AidB-like acyl-CoA dehydrogenase
VRAERATIPFVTADKVAESAAIRDGPLARVRRHRAEFESAGDKAEKDRTLPDEAVATLRSLGIFWLKTPAELGGTPLEPLDFCDVMEELAYTDTTTAWTAMVGNGALRRHRLHKRHCPHKRHRLHRKRAREMEGAHIGVATASVYAVETCAEVVADLFRYGGGRVLPLTSPVQRYLRDLLATRQHIGLSEENYERAGRFRVRMADTFYLWPESPAGRRCVSGS